MQALTYSDYEDNEALDRYEAVDIDDRESLPEMSRAARLAAEADMQRRDRGLPGRRAGRRENMPAFLQSDDDDADGMGEGPLAGVNPNRRRRQYDEIPDMDDVEEEEEMSLEHLGDIKAASIAEWVAIDVVRRAIQKHFKSFLMTYTDENGQSVYGQRIKHLGESRSSQSFC